MNNVIGIWAALLALFAYVVDEVATYTTNEQTGSVLFVILGVTLIVGALISRPTYGVEVEVIRKQRLLPTHLSLAEWLRKWTGRDVLWEGYTHQHIHDLKVVSDGSLNYGGSEVVFPVTEQNDFGLLRRLLNGLRGLASADGSCGFHVHIGLIPEAGHNYNHLNTEDRVAAVSWLYRITLAYGHFWDALCGVMPQSRRTSQWAQNPRRLVAAVEEWFERWGVTLSEHKTIAHAMNKVASMGSMNLRTVADEVLYRLARGRYYAVNCDSFSRYGTVEFRQHGGTTNPNHAVNWVRLVDNIVAVCRESFESNIRKLSNWDGSSIDALCDWLGLHPADTVRNHWLRRKDRFAGTLSAGQTCTSCERKDCDNDDYCPHNEYPTPKGYSRSDYEGENDSDDECGDCGWSFDNCECGSVSLVGMLGLLILPLVALIGCGVGGYHWAGRQQKVKAGLKRLWVGLASRGRDSAGLAFRSPKRNPNTGIATDYRGMWVHKAEAPAPAMTGVINTYLTPSTPVLMMHTRLATHGANNKVNAHPHRDPQGLGVTLVHNGMISNYLAVFKALKVKAETQCDSEAVAACLAAGGIASVVQHCRGSMSLIWTDDREGQSRLNFWSNGANPLAFGRLDNAKHGPVVVGSTQEHLKKAFRKRLKSVFDVTEGKHYEVQPDGTIESIYIANSLTTYAWPKSVYHYNESDFTYGNKKSKANKKALIDVTETTLLHEWDVEDNSGIRPDGSTYLLPQYLDPTDAADVADVESGGFDPYRINGWDNADSWDWVDVDYEV